MKIFVERGFENKINLVIFIFQLVFNIKNIFVLCKGEFVCDCFFYVYVNGCVYFGVCFFLFLRYFIEKEVGEFIFGFFVFKFIVDSGEVVLVNKRKFLLVQIVQWCVILLVFYYLNYM